MTRNRPSTIAAFAVVGSHRGRGHGDPIGANGSEGHRLDTTSFARMSNRFPEPIPAWR